MVAILIVLNIVVLTRHTETAEALQSARIQTVKEKDAREVVSKRFAELEQQNTVIDSSLREERLKAQGLQEENESLKVNLQAKKEREAQAKLEADMAAHNAQVAQQRQQALPEKQTVTAISGNKQSWLAASGIPQNEWGYVDSIVSRESGWNPNAVNPSSGACGLGQQLPCGKWAGAWNDPVAALVAQYGYVKERYGGYPQAVAFWNSNHWY